MISMMYAGFCTLLVILLAVRVMPMPPNTCRWP